MTVTILDPKTALIVIDLQQGIVSLPTVHPIGDVVKNARTLADLEQAKLVQRKPHPTDGRQILFELTIHGTEARRQRTIAKREWLLAAMTRLDPTEQRTLVTAAALIKRLAES